MIALQIAVILALLILIPVLFAIALYVVSLIPYVRVSPPFVPTDKRLVALVAETLNPGANSVMYELGAGDMRISLACFAREPAARYIGIEKHVWPRMLAKWRIWRARAKEHALVRCADLFTIDLKDATHVYCYLFPKPMEILHEKFRRELKPGTVVVSLDFPIEAKAPERTIDLAPRRLKLGKTLYLYRY